MSARDSESGSSTYKGGSGSAGGLGNGGIGGGMGGSGNYGGGGGGGAGRNGGYSNNTGLTTGNVWKGVAGRNGVSVKGRPGGNAFNPGAWGMWESPRIGRGPLSGIPRRPGVPAPAAIPGVNPVPEYVPPFEYDPMVPFEEQYPTVISEPWVNKIPGGWPGQGVTPQPRYLNDPNDLANMGPWTGKPKDYYNVKGGMGIGAYTTGRNPYGAPAGGSYNPGSRGPGQGGW